MNEPQRCATCGMALPFQAAACPSCGTPVAPPTQAVPPTSQYPPADAGVPPTQPVGGYGPGPQGGYPPQPPAGQYPPQGYPPAGGYPPQGYPPQGYPPQGPGGYPPGPPPQYATPPPGPGGPKKKGKGGLIALLGALVVLALAAVAFFVFRGDDDAPDEDEVVLQPITSAGANPWTDNFDAINEDLERLEVLLGDIPGFDEDDEADGVPLDGDEPGLFGGIRNEVACDKDGLGEQLTDDDAKAEAFAAVHDIDAGDMGDFIGDLTAVILRHDTRLADHGFVDGEAQRFESILERGTSVLVDTDGIPRVRCASGSPLVEPRTVTGEVKFRGAEWPDFDKARVIVVDGSDVGDAFVLIDNDTEDVFSRPVGSAGDEDDDAPVDIACELNEDSETCLGGDDDDDDAADTTTTEPVLGTGDIQFTLRWDSNADLDLAVTDPSGAKVDFGTETVPSGGALDVDANAACSTQDPPVENVFWPTGAAPAGTYTVEITYFSECEGGSGSQNFELTAVIAGTPQTQAGTLNAADEVQTFTFTL